MLETRTSQSEVKPKLIHNDVTFDIGNDFVKQFAITTHIDNPQDAIIRKIVYRMISI